LLKESRVTRPKPECPVTLITSWFPIASTVQSICEVNGETTDASVRGGATRWTLYHMSR
jgi:hypothetical protein